MSDGPLRTKLKSWRGAQSVREAMVEGGFGLFGSYATWLTEALGEPGEAAELLAFWNERARATMSRMSLGPHQLHPLEQRFDGTTFWSGVHDRAERQKRLEMGDATGTLPALKVDRLDVANLLRAAAEGRGFAPWKISPERRRQWGDLHSGVHAIGIGDLRFVVGHVKKTWGHPRLAKGSLPLVCTVSWLADPDDYFWLGDMRNLFPEAYPCCLYGSPQSAVWGANAFVALVEALAASFGGP